MHTQYANNSLLTPSLSHSPPQDKTIAYKIFELGLKRYGDDPAYVLSYLDHLSHLNGVCLSLYSISDVHFMH